MEQKNSNSYNVVSHLLILFNVKFTLNRSLGGHMESPGFTLR